MVGSQRCLADPLEYPQQMRVLLLVFGLLASLSTYANEAKTVQIRHTQSFDIDEIWAQMNLSPGFDTLRYINKKTELEYARKSLQDLCLLKGYYKCRINLVETGQNGFVVEVKEGPLFKLDSTIISIADSVHLDPKITTPNELFQSYLGQAFLQEEIAELSQNVLLHYQKNGYIHASMSQDIQIDSLKNRIKLHYTMNLGAQVIMGKMHISIKRIGKDSLRGLTLDQSIRKLWKINKGQVVALNDLFSFRRKLLQTGLFNRVEIKDTLVGTESDLNLFCIEKAPGSLSSKLFYSYDQVHDLGIGLNASHRNVAGAFHQISTELILSLRQQRFGFGYAQPLFLGFPLRFDIKPFYQHDKFWDPIQNFDFDKYSVTNRFGLSQSIGDHWSWQLSSDFGYRSVDYPSDNAELKIDAPSDRQELQIRIDPEVQFEILDDPIDPRLGYRAKIQYANGGAFDQERRFSTGRLAQYGYLPLGKGTMWAGVFEIGRFFHGSDPIEARLFYQGGFRTVRGYEALSLQPAFSQTRYSVWDSTKKELRDSLETMQYSEAPSFWRLCQELRFDIPNVPHLSGAIFVDYASIKDMHNPRLQAQSGISVGPGIRFKISMLSLRIDYAWWKNFDDFKGIEDFSLNRFSLDLSQAI